MNYIKKLIIHVGIILAKFLKLFVITRKYVHIFPPASKGSLGDEALLAGLYSLVKETSNAKSLRQATYPTWEPLHCPRMDVEAIYISVSDTQSNLKFIFSLLSCRHFMVLGADIMDGRYSHGLVEDIILFCNIAVKAGVPATILGFSFSDTPNERAVTALKKLDPRVTCFCRDPKSLERFQNKTGHSAELVADLAFHMIPELESSSAKDCAKWIALQRQSDKFILGFNINRLVTEKTGIDAAKIYAVELANLMDKQPDVSCVLLPHDLRIGQSDYDFLVELKDHLPNKIQGRTYLLYPPFDAWDVKALAGLSDLVVAGRMHLTIGALAQGVPAIGVTYQGKFEGLFGYFNSVDLLFDPSELTQTGALTTHIEGVISDIRKHKKNIKDNVKSAKNMSARNIKYL